MRGSRSRAISRDEWLWVSGCVFVVVLLVAVPYGIALSHPPGGYLLERTLYYGNDLSQYLAAMGDGAASTSWLVQDHLTAESHIPAFMYPFYVLLGKVAALLGLPALSLFATAYALAIPALVAASYYFVAAFSNNPGERRVCLLFLLFASGLGVWAALATSTGQPQESAGTGFSFDRAEVSSYLLPFGPPHLTLALALLLVWGRALADWAWGGGTSSLAVLALSAVGVWILNPFTLATLIALSCGYALWRWMSLGRFPAREAGAAALVGVVAAPLLAANLLTFALDPFWSVTYGRQNATGSPAPWTLMVDFGFLLPLAAVGALYRKTRMEGRELLVFWVVVLLALMYVPVPFQRRFGFGLQPALAVLGGLGMAYLGEAIRAHRGFLLRLGLRTVVALGLFSATMLGYATLLMAAEGIGPLGATIYEPAGNVQAAGWLASHSGKGDVVLASAETGNYLAGRIRGRVVVGHKAGTLDYDAKEALMKDFFDPTSSPSKRLELARDGHVTLVFLGKRERALGGTPLSAEEGYGLVYDAGGVQIYRFDPGFLTKTDSTSPLKTSCHSPLA